MLSSILSMHKTLSYIKGLNLMKNETKNYNQARYSKMFYKNHIFEKEAFEKVNCEKPNTQTEI